MIALLASEVAEDGRDPSEVRLTQSELAALLGATRQHVNRVLRDLAENGLVQQQYGTIEILDAHRLIELAGVGVGGSNC